MVLVAGGCGSINLIQTAHFNAHRAANPLVLKHAALTNMPVLDAAQTVANCYSTSCQAQGEYAWISYACTAAAQAAELFVDEIISVTAAKLITNQKIGEVTEKEVTLTNDEGNLPTTDFEDLSGLKVIRIGRTITGRNSSQLSDGAAAVVLMDGTLVSERNLQLLGVYRGIAIAGCKPHEIVIGPVFSIPKLLTRNGLTMEDIDLWELSKDFAAQGTYCRGKLGIPMDRLNVNGSFIFIRHPIGMNGAHLVIQALMEGKHRDEKTAVITISLGGGIGATGLFEVV